MIGLVVGAALIAVVGVVLGVTLGFSFRDHLERRICGWFLGRDDE